MPATLQARLDAIKKSFAAKAPPEAQAIMHRATEALAASGQAERALGVGDRLPPFALPAPDGRAVTSSELLARGPVVLTVFRGRW
ncbi:MAG: hypothetical protein AAF628_06090 [Planctomycetota bacterium]